MPPQYPLNFEPAEVLSHSEWTHHLARGLLGDRALAEDLAQDTLLLWLETERSQIRNLKAWTVGVLTRLLRQRRRREATRGPREREAARSESSSDEVDLLARAEVHQKLAGLVLHLAEPHRSLLLQRYFAGMLPRAIARERRCAVSTVSNALTRAHEALRRRIHAELGADSDASDWLNAGVALASPPRAAGGWGLATWLGFVSAKTSLGVAGTALLLAFAWVLIGPSGTGGQPGPGPQFGVDLSEDPGSAPDDPSTAELRATLAAAQQPAGLRARLRDQHGAPLPGVDLRVRAGTRSWQVKSDPQGLAGLQELPAGEKLSISLWADGQPQLEAPAQVELRAGETRTLGWRLWRSCHVHGLAVLPDGSSAGAQTILILRPTPADQERDEFLARIPPSRVLAKTRSDTAGMFRFAGLRPGSYLIGAGNRGPDDDYQLSAGMTLRKVRKHGREVIQDVPLAERVCARFERLQVPADRRRTSCRVTVWKGLMVGGRVEFPDGRPAMGSRLILSSPTSSGYLVSQNRGRAFRIGPLSPGRYRLSGEAPKGWVLPGTFDVTAGKLDYRFVLQPAGKLGGELLVPAAAARAEGWIRILRSEKEDRAGAGLGKGAGIFDRFEFEGLEPGLYHLRFTSRDGRWCGFLADLPVGSEGPTAFAPLQVVPAATLEVRNPTPGSVQAVVYSAGHLYDWGPIGARESRKFAVPAGRVRVDFQSEKHGARRGEALVVGLDRAVSLSYRPD